MLAKCTPSERGCLEWPGNCQENGYGLIVAEGHTKGKKILRASRVAWEILRGQIPDGMEVLHECDNPPCVNIEHLKLGTHAENMADMAKRNRTGNRRLTNEQVKQIRELHKTVKSSRKVAKAFGVTKGTVLQIINNKTWKYA